MACNHRPLSVGELAVSAIPRAAIAKLPAGTPPVRYEFAYSLPRGQLIDDLREPGTRRQLHLGEVVAVFVPALDKSVEWLAPLASLSWPVVPDRHTNAGATIFQWSPRHAE